MVIVAQLVEPRIVVPAVVGSSPIGHPRLAITKTRLSIYGIVTEGYGGPLAQLVEQLTLNQRVAGSSPARPTNKINGLVGRDEVSILSWVTSGLQMTALGGHLLIPGSLSTQSQ